MFAQPCYLGAVPITPDEPLDTAETASLFRRIVTAVYELNLMLRAMSMNGNSVPVDTVERTDSISGTDYSEVVVSGIPLQEEEHGR